MVKAAYSETFSAFYFNLHAEVGPNCQNRQDDVELVRFGLMEYALEPENRGLPGMAGFLALTAQMKSSGPYDAKLGEAILALQKVLRLTADGKVSVIKGDFAPSGRTYLLQHLLATIRHRSSAVYPRIDLLPGTGPLLSQAVRRIFTGT